MSECEWSLHECLGFFASVIKSGEPWTETCEKMYATAKRHIAELQKRIVELEAFAKCPIGLDASPDICSAGTCRHCLTGLRAELTVERQRRESVEWRSTPAMRSRIRELARPDRDDYDRAVIAVLDDFDHALMYFSRYAPEGKP